MNPSDFYSTATALGRLLKSCNWKQSEDLDFDLECKAYAKYYRIEKILRQATVGQLRRLGRSNQGSRRCRADHAKAVLRFLFYNAMAPYMLAEYYRTDFKDDEGAEQEVDSRMCDYINAISVAWKFARITRIGRGWFDCELEAWIRYSLLEKASSKNKKSHD